MIHDGAQVYLASDCGLMTGSHRNFRPVLSNFRFADKNEAAGAADAAA
jgi:hypothetical protein